MPDATADCLAVSVTGKDIDEDFLMGGAAGQEYPEGDPLSSPLKNKAPVVGMGADVNMHVDDSFMRDADGQPVTEFPMRDASSVGRSLDTQETIMGTEDLQEELARKGHTLEQQLEGRKQIENVTLDNANTVTVTNADVDVLDTAPVGLVAQGQCVKEIVSRLVSVQDSTQQTQEQEDEGLSQNPTEEVELSVPSVTCLGQPANAHGPQFQYISNVSVEGEATAAADGTEVGDDEVRTRAEPVNPEPLRPGFIDETASIAIAGYDPMEVDTVASKAPGQTMPASLPAEQESMALDYGTVEHGDTQAAHADTAETVSEPMLSTGHGNTTADIPPQRPGLTATDGWLRIKVPEHFQKARNQLAYIKYVDDMKPAPQDTPLPSRPATRSMSTRKQPKIKLNFTAKGKAQDGYEPGGPSSSAAAPQDTPRKSGPRDGGLYDGAIGEEEPTSSVDSGDEVVLLVSPSRVGGGAAATAAVDGKSGLPLSGADPALATGNETELAGVAGVAAGRVTKSRGRGRGRGGRGGRSGRGTGRGRRGR